MNSRVGQGSEFKLTCTSCESCESCESWTYAAFEHGWRYSCYYISEKNLALSSFSRHMKDSTTQACTICRKSFQTLGGLESHQSKAHVVKLFHTLSVISASTQAWTNITSPIISEGSMQVKVQIVLFAISATQENKMNIYWGSTCSNIKNQTVLCVERSSTPTRI